MQSFAYKAYRPDGSTEDGVIEAIDRHAALQLLTGSNRKPFRINQLRSRKWWLPSFQDSGTHVKQNAWARLFGDLSVLLDAGFNPKRALDVMESADTAPNKKLLLTIRQRLEKGETFSGILSKMPNLQPAIAHLVAAGESAGQLPSVIARISEDFRVQAERRQALIEACSYPIFLSAMVILALLFLAFFLVPSIEPIFDGQQTAKPTVITVLSALRSLLAGYYHVILGSAAAILAAGYLARGSLSLRRSLDVALLKIPFVGTLLREINLARYLDTLALLTGGNVGLVDALKLSSETCSNSAVRERLLQVYKSVETGDALHSAFSRTMLFDVATLSLVRIGEESNQLSPLLKQTAVLKEARTRKAMDRFLVILTPAITISMGVLIGGIIVSVMTALLRLNDIAIR